MSTCARKPAGLHACESVSTYVHEIVNICAYKCECACMRACECVGCGPVSLCARWPVDVCAMSLMGTYMCRCESASGLHQKTAEV